MRVDMSGDRGTVDGIGNTYVRQPVARPAAAAGAEPLWQRWKTVNYRKYERIAAIYDLVDGPYEILWKSRLRRPVFAGATGLMMVEIGRASGREIGVPSV